MATDSYTSEEWIEAFDYYESNASGIPLRRTNNYTQGLISIRPNLLTEDWDYGNSRNVYSWSASEDGLRNAEDSMSVEAWLIHVGARVDPALGHRRSPVEAYQILLDAGLT